MTTTSSSTARSETDTYPLPDLGTMWDHPKHGLVLITGIHELADTYYGEILYTFHIYRLMDAFHTEGIFSVSDWDTQFTRVA